MKQVKTVEIQPANIEQLKVTIEGDSLLFNKMSNDVKELLSTYWKGTKDVKGKKLNRNKLEKDICKEKTYFTEKGKPGIPASAVKKAIYLLAYHKDKGLGAKVKGGIQVKGDILPIKYKKETVHKAMGRVQRVPMELVRPQFTDWSCDLTIQYDADEFDAGSVLNLLNMAGYRMGIGAWRPQCNGTHGTFTVKANK